MNAKIDKDNKNSTKSSKLNQSFKQPNEVRRRRSVCARVIGTRIKVYRNGDIFYKGLKVVINTKQVGSVEAFLDVINDKIGLTNGAKKLYTLNGELIKSIEQIENDKEYVAATNTFTSLPYGQNKLIATANGSTKKDVTGSNSLKPMKVPLRASRSVDLKKEKMKENHPVKRSETTAPPQNKEQTFYDAAMAKKKKSKKDGSVKDISMKETGAEGAVVRAASSSGSSSIASSKRPKAKKKKVKVERNPSVVLEAPPEFSIDAGGQRSASTPVAERAPTPIPVAEISESDNENDTNDQINDKSAKAEMPSSISNTTVSDESSQNSQRIENAKTEEEDKAVPEINSKTETDQKVTDETDRTST